MQEIADEKNEGKLISHVTKKIPGALLVSTYSGAQERKICEEHLDELELLVETFGAAAVQKISVPLRKYDASIFIGKGKLQELVQMADEHKVDYIIFDDEISPAQQRNLEKEFGRSVMDRTEVILGVFAQRAQTKEARLQIELAKVRYEAPRLKRLWTHLSRQQGTSGSGGSGGYLKGEGEKQIEIDRRIIKRKIDLLQKELEEVKAVRNTQRLSRIRSEIPVFAIIGYTNAGKSTLLNALTDAGVFVEDKLFATLDTATRKFTLKNNREILLVDTVGFIRKLPHLLIAAFKSTLEEAVEADILLHLIDASHPMAEEQAATSYEVLKELGAGKKTIITVLNKMDKDPNPDLVRRLRLTYPKNIQISALTHLGFDDLQEAMIRELSLLRRVVVLRIPQEEYAVVSEVMREGHVVHTEYEGNDIVLEADLSVALSSKLAKYQVS